MRLYNIKGRLQSKNVSKYLIDWDGKSRSKIQFSVKQFLKSFWKNQIVYEEFPVYGTRLKVDILNATKKIAIEVQGKQQSQFNKFYHKNSASNYLSSIKRDVQKREWLELNNFKILEIEQEDINQLSLEYIEKTFNVSIL